MPQAFVSHDGEDNRGVRAEVWVQTGRSKIIDIQEKDKTVSVTVRGEGLKHNAHGWVSKEDPIYAKIVEAYDQRREIEYRLESQRKKTVDRNTPIKELRADMNIARENTVQIFAGIDGELSREAVTHPSEDSSGDRIKATGVQSQSAASAAPSVAVAQEASRVSTIVKIERAVRAHLSKNGLKGDDLNRESVAYTSLLLAVIEKVTASREGETFALISDVAVDTVENYLPINVNHDNDSAWAEAVRNLTTARFRLVHSLTNGNGAVSVPEPVSAPAVQSVPVSNSGASQGAQAVASAGNNDDLEDNQVVDEPPADDEPPLEELEDVASDAEVFVASHDNAEGPRASKETVGALRDLVAEAEIPQGDIKLVGALLKRTFGVTKAVEVSEANLQDFIDYYIAFGADSFREVLETVR